MKWCKSLKAWWHGRHQRRRERAVNALAHYRAVVALRLEHDGDLSRLPTLAEERSALRRTFQALRKG
jgi:hypothetical protein